MEFILALALLIGMYFGFMYLIITIRINRKFDAKEKRRQKIKKEREKLKQNIEDNNVSSQKTKIEPKKSIEVAPSTKNLNSLCPIKTNSSKKHKELIGKNYTLKCKTDIFNEIEIDVLEHYGTWLSALTTGQVEAESDEQAKFISNYKDFRALSLSEMFSYHKNISSGNFIQDTWFKYLCRIKFEQENSSLN